MPMQRALPCRMPLPLPLPLPSMFLHRTTPRTSGTRVSDRDPFELRYGVWDSTIVPRHFSKFTQFTSHDNMFDDFSVLEVPNLIV